MVCDGVAGIRRHDENLGYQVLDVKQWEWGQDGAFGRAVNQEVNQNPRVV
jgi:hypothetical protein